jgi:hypothetical protein
MDKDFRDLGKLVDRVAKHETQSSFSKHEATMGEGKLDAPFDFNEYAATKHDSKAS